MSIIADFKNHSLIKKEDKVQKTFKKKLLDFFS